MDKIQKFLAALGKKERGVLANILRDIQSGQHVQYDVKALKGYKGFYRLRKGKIRIVFVKHGQGISLVSVTYRKDAYRNL